MDKQKYNNYPLAISQILGLIEANDVAIPEIQRPFVWRRSQVRDLMDSLYKGYPTGYIIIWKNPSVKLKDGTMSQGKKAPKEYLNEALEEIQNQGETSFKAIKSEAEFMSNLEDYNTDDGLSSVVLVSADGMVWLSQMQMAKLFATSKQTVSCYISNILKENELTKQSVVKEILTTAAGGSFRASTLFRASLPRRS